MILNCLSFDPKKGLLPTLLKNLCWWFPCSFSISAWDFQLLFKLSFIDALKISFFAGPTKRGSVWAELVNKWFVKIFTLKSILPLSSNVSPFVSHIQIAMKNIQTISHLMALKILQIVTLMFRAEMSLNIHIAFIIYEGKYFHTENCQQFTHF